MSKKRRSLNYHHDINIEDMICDDDDDDGDYVCRSSLRNNNQHVGGNESNCSDVSISEIESEDDDNEDDEDDDEIASESESDDGSYSDSTTDEEDSSCEESFEAKYNTEQFEENSEKPTDDQETLNDEQKECPICLVEFNGQIIGNPENCRHFFCVVCIKEWAKTVNSCPIDRMKFNVINVQRSVNGALLEEYYVDDIDPDKKEEFEMDPTFCQVCNLCDREDRLLLCDECDNGYHLECLTPPLDHVPIEDWYCSRCDSNRTQNTSLVREVQSPVAAAMATAPARGRIRGARTAGGAARVARARRALLAARNINPVLVDDYLPRSTSARGRKRRRTTKGRKTKSNSRRRKTASSGGAKKRRRRSTKTRRVTKKRRLSKKKTKVEEEEVMVNDEFVKRLASERHSLGSASLERTLSFSLFGNIYDLDAFEGPVPEKEEQKKKDTARPEVDANPDILGKIFDGFDTIDDSDNVTVRRDGSLVRKPGKRAKQITSENEEDAQSSSSMRSARNMKSVLKSESSSTAFSSTIDSKETSSAPRNLVDYSPVKTRLRRSMENSRVSSLAPIVSPSLVDLGCWRESAQNECRDYKPLPAVEKFKNIKIPKLKRPVNDKLSDSDATRKKTEGRMENNRDNNIKEEQSLNDRVDEDRQDFTKPNCRLKRSSATKNEFSSANLSKRIVKMERHNPLRRGSPLCLLGDVPVNHGPGKSGIDVEYVKKRGGSWNDSRTSLNNADDNTSAERHRNLRSASGASLTSRSAASLPVRNYEVSGANLIKDYRIPRVKASTSLPVVKIEKQACKPSTPVDIIERILVGDSEDMGEDTYGHIVSETVDFHTGQKEDSELKTVTDAKTKSNLLFKSKDKRKSLVEKVDYRASSIDHQRDIRKTVKSEYQADVFRHGNDQSVSSKLCSTKPICALVAGKPASVAGKPEIIETSPQHYKQRGSADDVTKSSTRKISLFGRPMLPCGEKLVAKIVARLQRTFIAEQECKKALKPYFKDGRINKDEYKNILKKSVDKIKASSKEIIVDKVEGLIGKYVDHFRGKTAGLKRGASEDKNTSHIC
eukprot:gene401-1035_t